MNLRRSAVILAVVVLSVLPAVAQDQYALQMKYAVGEQRPMRVTLTGIGSVAVDAPGAPKQPSDLWMNATVDLSQETKSVDTRGTADVEWRLDSLEAEIQVMGMRQNITVEGGHLQITVNDQLVFDSLDPEQAKKNPMLALLGQGFLIKQDRTGKVVGMPQFELLLAMAMPGVDLKAAFEQSTGPLPPGPVKVGDTWEERQVWPYGVPEGMERPVFITRHTFEGLELMGGRQCAKIASESNVEIVDMPMAVPTMMMMQPPGAPKMMGMTINKMAMDMTGTQYFDLEQGFPAKMEASLSLNLDMKQTLEIPPQPKPEGQRDQAAPQDGQPGAPQDAAEDEGPRQVGITIAIEDLVMDIVLETAQ